MSGDGHCINDRLRVAVGGVWNADPKKDLNVMPIDDPRAEVPSNAGALTLDVLVKRPRLT